MDTDNLQSTNETYIKEITDTPLNTLPHKEVISIQPGDVIVLSVPEEITADRVKIIEGNAQNIFPQCKVVVLASGMSLEVYREQVKADLADSGWISVNDRLPETTKTVTSFIVCDDVNIWCDAWVYSHKDRATGDFAYQWQDGRPITHWKPIALPGEAINKVTND